ncbi:MAG TPA: 4-(cytidine 5'-diphospho)-2-C-methyl-D-erythritol kinase [Bryobacteraceae bacterium]|nr:4-(cytidine 5'-diphospho)-2-C-methyl-D-erythritol kinase [Bryobacteraceae bacterium]
MKVTVPSLAKLNLDLRVLAKRSDGFHELRTIFQTISLGDRLTIDFDFAKRTQIDLSSSIDIPDNLVVRSAKLLLEHLKMKAWVRFSLLKRIPMGAGLGGGSSNAASVLLALPALAGKHVAMLELVRLAESLGSDVPFFLYGGTALGIGRGTELYPLPDLPPHPALVVATGVHVSTAEAYRTLGRDVTDALTSQAESPILREFQTSAWALAAHRLSRLRQDQIPLRNDFEEAVFGRHPELVRVARKLKRLGAKPALMTGSGSAIFGLFAAHSEAAAAASRFPLGTAFPVRFVTRRRYRQMWDRALNRGETTDVRP